MPDARRGILVGACVSAGREVLTENRDQRPRNGDRTPARLDFGASVRTRPLRPLVICSATSSVARSTSSRPTRRPATSPHRKPRTAPSQTIASYFGRVGICECYEFVRGWHVPPNGGNRWQPDTPGGGTQQEFLIDGAVEHSAVASVRTAGRGLCIFTYGVRAWSWWL
jgi:hypothetical protein